jgi:hypothetical protein
VRWMLIVVVFWVVVSCRLEVVEVDCGDVCSGGDVVELLEFGD